MLKGKNSFACSIPFTCSLEHGLMTKSYIKKEMEKETMTHASFVMEYCGKFYNESDSAFYKSDVINPCRTLRRPFYPPTTVDYLKNKNKRNKAMPKQPNEIRIIGADIAISAGKQNDNSVFSLLRVLPNGGIYERQLVHMESHNGMKPDEQALIIKRLFKDFEADYIALDRSGVGSSVWSELQKITEDSERGEEYPAYTSMNDDNTVDKIASRGALPVVYTIAHPSVAFNSDIATGLLASFQKKKLKLLIDHMDARTEMLEKSGGEFLKSSPDEQARTMLPYVQTTALVNELINLEYTILNGSVRINEKGSARKDRYSSCAYANWLANMIEQEEEKKKKRSTKQTFAFW
ncbi:MAG: hypothetical protein ACRDDY_19335 [Clostridium sp.]|uniref:phage terminase large subunit family protein n=1 Tax=Clostridium sp. TaxID=1506 RepID=UPI003EE5582F